MTASNQPRTDGASAIIERVEVQRTQLRRAVSVLACARFALNYSDWIEDESGLDCADVVAVACDLVQVVMTALDRVNLQPSAVAPRSRRSRSSRAGRRARRRAIGVPAAESIQSDAQTPGTPASSQ